ncbi:MAG: DUF1588 domain-containing protein [Pirellulales bacterium]
MKQLFYILLCVIIMSSSTRGDNGFVAEGIEGFDAVVQPFLKKHCYDCHAEDDPEGGMNLNSLSLQIKTETQAYDWLKALDQIQADLMPPLEENRPDTAERAQVIYWIENALIKSGHAEAYRRKMLLPSYGNYVDHDLLFSGKITAQPYSPARLWRTSPYIFNQMRGVGKVKGVQNPFTYSTPATSLRDYASTSDVGASVVETITLNANAEIEYQFAQAETLLTKPINPKTRPNPFVPFLKEAAEISDEQMTSIITSTFNRLTSRPPTSAELIKYVDFLKLNLAETDDPRRSLKAVLTAIYLSPEAIYRMEWGLGETDIHGRRLLSPEETATALAYALFDAGPNQGGRAENEKVIAKALLAGQLNTQPDVAKVVREILATEQYNPIGGQVKNSVPRVMRFFHEFFGYDRAVGVFKDQRRVNEHGLWHDPRTLVKDADNLIKVILREDKNVFERLLTTNETLVFHDGVNQKLVDQHNELIAQLQAYDEEDVRKEIEKRKAGVLKKPLYKARPELVKGAHEKIDRDGQKLLAQKKAELARLLKNGVSLDSVKSRNYRYIRAYNLDTRSWEWPAEQPFTSPKDQRAGILTHPAWLVAHSVNDGNHPIHRGIWVYEKLLAGVIADVPPSVDARVPEDPHKTLRQRLDVLRDNACWKCHVKINPLGEPFEMYDDFGRFRTKHYFEENKELITRTAEHVPGEDGKEVVRAIDRDQLVAEGKFTTKPVVATGTFDELGIPELSGDFDGAVEMAHAIAKTDRARQSIIRHMFRYFMGRNEMLSDSKTLIDADHAYIESGGSFKVVVVSLLSSDSFLYRR